MLFPNVERDIEFADQAMSDFEFLARCKRDECQNVRELMETWFSRYPEADSEDLRHRIQSDDERNFRSSFWELYIHELLVSLGYSVEVHPELDTEKETRPDFLAIAPSGREVIVEATSPTRDTEEPPAATRRKEVVIDTINDLDHPDFELSLETSGTRSWPRQSPSGSAVRSELNRWLNTLEYNRLRRALEEQGLDAMPKKEFDLEGWKIRFTAIPRSEQKRGSESDSIIKVRFSGAQWVDSSSPIRKKIKDKATRYGDIDRPYVIAVNIDDPAIDEIDIMDALFGDEALQLHVDQEGKESTNMVRLPEGAWVYRTEQINTRVSAVLIGADVKPWRVAQAPLILCHNPWAQRECVGPITELVQYLPSDSRMKKVSGAHPRRILDLPAQWPKIST
jgi:hypothetical protein